MRVATRRSHLPSPYALPTSGERDPRCRRAEDQQAEGGRDERAALSVALVALSNARTALSDPHGLNEDVLPSLDLDDRIEAAVVWIDEAMGLLDGLRAG